jgi:hypothetical protein
VLADDDTRQWAQRLAAATAPQETGIADGVVEAYLAGGAQREAILRPGRTGSGSAGVELVTALAAVLQAVDVAGVHLKALLDAEATGNALNLLALIVGIKAYRTSKANRPPQDPPVDPELAARARAAVDRMQTSLEKSGLPADEAHERAVLIIKELLAAPASAAAFVRRVSAEAAAEPHSGPPNSSRRWFRRGGN